MNKLFKHAPIIREAAAAGVVLVKNRLKKDGKHRALPLKTLKGHTPNRIAVVGSDAAPAYSGPNFFGDRGGVDGVVGVGWGSGSADYSTLISPYEALQARAAEDGTGFDWTFNDTDYQSAKEISDERSGVDAALVFLQSGECCDSFATGQYWIRAESDHPPSFRPLSSSKIPAKAILMWTVTTEIVSPKVMRGVTFVPS